MNVAPIRDEEPPERRLVPFHGRQTEDTDQAQDEDVTQSPAADTDTDQAPDRGRLVQFLGTVVGISLVAVIVAPVTLSATHLVKWAHDPTGLNLPVYFAWLVFVALDLAAVACIGMVTLCAKRGESAGAFSVATWAFAFASAAANFQGATGAGRWFFPAMSLAGPTLLEMVLSKVKAWARIAEGTQLSARPKFGIRWLPGIAFTETRRAWAVARRENIAKATDAIARVREIDVLAGMNDTDAVRYAQAAIGDADTYQVRQWLTSRNKVVAQTALGALEPAPTVKVERVTDNKDHDQDEDVLLVHPDGYAISNKREPEPVARKALEGPRPRPRPVKAPAADMPKRTAKGDPTSNPKWTKGVDAFRKSIADGNPMSQRELADHLEMKNRTLAAQIIAHVRREMEG
jgi:hypothetical protein